VNRDRGALRTLSTSKGKLVKIHLIAAVFALSPAAFAHPGHGTAPAPDASGKPHVHFGTPKAPAAAPRALPAGDTRSALRATAKHGKRAQRQELSHTH
jgi:hypothetical protein